MAVNQESHIQWNASANLNTKNFVAAVFKGARPRLHDFYETVVIFIALSLPQAILAQSRSIFFTFTSLIVIDCYVIKEHSALPFKFF